MYEGDYRKLFDSPATYEKVTSADVQKAAALVFEKNHRTVGVLQRHPANRRSKRPRARRQSHDALSHCY